MSFDFAGFFASIKRFWVLHLVILAAVVLFFSGPIFAAYQWLRRTVPGASNLPDPK